MENAENGSANISNNELALSRYYQEAIPIYAVAIPCLLTVCLLGVLANCGIVFCTLLVVKVKTLILKLTSSLAASDSFSLLLIATSLLLNSYLPTIHGISYRPGICWQFLLEALRLGSIQCSMLHVLMLAIGQQLAVSWPAIYRQIDLKPQWHLLLLTFLWLSPPIFYLLVFLANFQKTFGLPDCTSSTLLYSPGFRAVVVLLIFIPLSAIVILYMNVWRMLRSRLHHENSAIRRTALHLSQRHLSLVLAVFATFLLGWLPATVWYGVTCDQCPFPVIVLMGDSPKLVYTVSIVTMLSLILKGLLNPLVYARRVPEIRTALHHTYRSLQQALGGDPPPENV